MRYSLLIISFLASAVACSGRSPTSSDAEAVPSDAIALGDESIQNPVDGWRVYGGLERRERLVIDNEVEWARLWSRLNQNVGGEPRHPAPAVDFDRYKVIVASMGRQPTGGYWIGVEGVHRRGSDMYVVVHEISPGRRCGVTLATTTPTTAALVPRMSGRVFFVDRRSTRDCD